MGFELVYGLFNRIAIKISKLDVASQEGFRMTDPVEFWQVFCNGLIYAYLRKKNPVVF